MNWEYAISHAQIADLAPAAGTPMDSEEFAAFYERSARSLWAYLARVSGNPTLADDLMQESYLRFLNASIREQGELARRSYLFRIATNLLRDHWRRPRVGSLEDLSEGVFARRETSNQSDARIALEPALAAMRPRDRQLLWLAYAEGYTHKEIAEITGLQPTSVRLMLFRARRKIARKLRGQDSAPPETA